jgi:hypothetical protein
MTALKADFWDIRKARLRRLGLQKDQVQVTGALVKLPIRNQRCFIKQS